MVSGCAAPSPTDDVADDPATPEIPGTNLLLSDCVKYQSTMNLPPPLHPIPPPPQWGPQAPFFLSGYMFTHITCQHVSWGPFARGPITFAFEYYFHYKQPDNCRSGTNVGMMLSAGIDDPDIEAYARTQYDWPTYNLTMEVTTDEAAGAGTITLQWGPQNQTKSTITMAGYGPIDIDAASTNARIYWGNDTAVSSLNLVFMAPQDFFDNRASHGTIASPMRFAEEDMPEWIGASDRTLDLAEIQGTITEYKDWQCTPQDHEEPNGTAARPASVQGALYAAVPYVGR